MKFILATIASILAVANAAPTAEPAAAPETSPNLEARQQYGPYFLTSYAANNCGGVLGQAAYYSGRCSNLNFGASSIQIRTQNNSPVFPRGCTLLGFQSRDCTGNQFLSIGGPPQANNGFCYVTQSSYTIQSVALNCQ